MLCFGVFSFMSNAQTVISGKILDSLSNPISSVTVVEKGTNNRVSSGEDGVFVIRTRYSEGILLFEHIGYRRGTHAFPFSEGKHIIQLQANSSLIEEVQISTGYQTVPQERATGSFEFLNNENFNLRPAMNILDRLEGMVSGLQFDSREGTASVNIRGINTMTTGTMGPMIVVDNFPFEGELNDINPNDVASVSFLKDAAAASIWGARAGNGVIVINLKKVSSQGMKIEFSTNLSLSEKKDLYYMPYLSSSYFIDIEKFLYEQGYYNTRYNSTRNSKTTVFSPVVEMLYQQSKSLIDAETVEKEIERLRGNDYRQDLLKYIYKSQVIQQQHVAISNRYNSGGYRISFGYDNDGGDVVNTGRKRYALAMHNQIIFSPKFDAKVDFNYTSNIQQINPTGIDYTYSPGGTRSAIYPYANLFEANGMASQWPNTYNMTYVAEGKHPDLLDWIYRPMEDINRSSGESVSNLMRGQLNLGYRPFKGVEVQLLYNIENSPSAIETLYDEDSFFVRNLVNRFTQVSGSTATRVLPEGAIRNDYNESLLTHRGRVQAAYNEMFGNNHVINIFVGAEVSNSKSGSSTYRVYGYDRNTLAVQPVDLLNYYTIYDALASQSRIPSVTGFEETTARFVSFFGNMGYTFQKKYDLTFSTRRDASNRFGVNTNAKWNPLWSLGIGWQLSREDFLSEVPWLDNLKIRATYGHSGNVKGSSNAYPIISYTSPLDDAVTQVSRAYLSRLSNPDLKWEDVRTVNLGIDFTVFTGKINGTVEFYNKKSSDLISDDMINPTTGFTTATRNVGIIKGNGVDVRLNGAWRLGAVRMNTSLLFSHSVSKVDRFNGSIGTSSSYTNNAGKTLWPLPGRMLYPVFSYRFAGLDPETGDPLGYLDGTTSKNYTQLLTQPLDSLNYHGTALPPYYGSWIQSFSYRNFDLSVVVGYKFGHYYQKSTVMYGTMFSSWKTHTDYEKRWQNPGDEDMTSVPSMLYPADANRDTFYGNSQANVIKGDIIRLQNIRLSYRTDLNRLKTKMTLFVAASNLGVIWRANRDGIDTDYNAIPPTGNYTMGLTFNY